MKTMERTWINMARYTSPPIGKGRMIEARTDPGDGEGVRPGIWIRIAYDDGHEYAGRLTRLTEEISELMDSMPLDEEEE